jgi:hypothetical protein
MLVRPRFLVTAKHITHGPYISPDFLYLIDHDEVDHYDQRFQSLFGVGPEVCDHIWHHLSSYSWKPLRMRPKHLLWTLMFLKVYSSELVLSVMVRASRKTFRKWVWLLLPLIANTAPFVVGPLPGATKVAILPFSPHRFVGAIDSGVIRARCAR